MSTKLLNQLDLSKGGFTLCNFAKNFFLAQEKFHRKVASKINNPDPLMLEFYCGNFPAQCMINIVGKWVGYAL